MQRSGAAAEAYEEYKRTYLNTAADCQQHGLSFVPLVAECSGGWGPSAMCTFKALAKAAAARSDSEAEVIMKERLQLLCTGIRRANARAVLRRDPGSGEQLAGPALAALDALSISVASVL